MRKLICKECDTVNPTLEPRETWEEIGNWDDGSGKQTRQLFCKCGSNIVNIFEDRRIPYR